MTGIESVATRSKLEFLRTRCPVAPNVHVEDPEQSRPSDGLERGSIGPEVSPVVARPASEADSEISFWGALQERM